MDRRRLEELYRDYVIAPRLERRPLLELLRSWLGDNPTVLYPGCFLHVTVSFFFERVVYVDRNPVARDFFASLPALSALVAAHKQYAGPPFIRFLEADFTGDLKLPLASCELLLALYAGSVSSSCARYLRPGGLLVSNDHGGDALEASCLPDLRLERVLHERRGGQLSLEEEVEGYLAPAPVRRGPARSRTRRAYRRQANYYVFRKLEPGRKAPGA